MAMEAVAAYGTAQEINDENGDPYETMEVIESTIEYMNTIENKLSPTAKKYCRNGHKECSIFAVDDECNSEIEYMAITCAPTCKLCHLFTCRSTSYSHVFYFRITFVINSKYGTFFMS